MKILIIGFRKKCIQAALDLGHEVILWSDGPIQSSIRKKLSGRIEEPYSSCKEGLPDSLKSKLDAQRIDRVIANTEESVILGARVRKHLGLPLLAENIVEKFHNKYVMKKAARALGVPITGFVLIDEATRSEQLIQELKLPVVIKPVDESGAQDVVICRGQEELERFMKPGLLAEAFVDGSELSVETFIDRGKPVFHNITEYMHQWKKSIVPAGFEEDLKCQILELNDKVLDGFGVDRGVTHAEFYLTKSGPVFGEIAIRPPGGYYMDLIQKVYGFDPWEAYVKLSCGQSCNNLSGRFPNGHAVVMMFHPGSGKITQITGEDTIKKNVNHIVDFSMRKKVGDTVSAHENTSNEVGHIIFWEEQRNDALETIALIEREMQIKVE